MMGGGGRGMNGESTWNLLIFTRFSSKLSYKIIFITCHSTSAKFCVYIIYHMLRLLVLHYLMNTLKMGYDYTEKKIYFPEKFHVSCLNSELVISIITVSMRHMWESFGNLKKGGPDIRWECCHFFHASSDKFPIRILNLFCYSVC